MVVAGSEVEGESVSFQAESDYRDQGTGEIGVLVDLRSYWARKLGAVVCSSHRLLCTMHDHACLRTYA